MAMNSRDHQRENHIMVNLDRAYDSLYEEILPSTNTFSRNSVRTDETDRSYAVYQKPKSSTNKRNRSWFIIIWTLVLVVIRWVFKSHPSSNLIYCARYTERYVVYNIDSI